MTTVLRVGSLKRPYPLGNFGQIGANNRLATANYSAGDSVFMAYLLGDWATDGQAIAVAGGTGRPPTYIKHVLISSPTDRRATTISMVVNRLVGMGL